MYNVLLYKTFKRQKSYQTNTSSLDTVYIWFSTVSIPKRVRYFKKNFYVVCVKNEKYTMHL